MSFEPLAIDWALMENWKEKGVPLHVVLRGIEHAFDSHDAKPRQRSVKSLMYCQEEVEAQYAEWLDSQTGASAATTDEHESGTAASNGDERLPFPRSAITDHLARARERLLQICLDEMPERNGNFCDALKRASTRLREIEDDFAKAARPNAEQLEDSLTSLEKMLDESLRASVAPDELLAARAETEAQLKPYRTRMERATYEQTFDNMLLKRLREQHGLPRLSLFYL
jgi:ElaB/YqjD/DUF883 family membrane-anchored ribosome-binding protein